MALYIAYSQLCRFFYNIIAQDVTNGLAGLKAI
jgi:hypothetical protein